MLQAALTIHDNDADSAMGVSLITDDRSSCRFSDDEEVSVCMYTVMLQFSIVCKKVCNCAKAGNNCIVESSNSSSVMPAVQICNFDK